MKFSELDEKMRVYEKAHDVCVLPGIYIVARLDGRSFHRVTENYEKPFDDAMFSVMTSIAEHIIANESLEVTYGYWQSDEISLLFKRDANVFNRKERKLNSVLASVASSIFSIKKNVICSFDSRICQLPTKELVKDYFRWRQADCFRNCLNSYSYWTLRKLNHSARSATKILDNMPSEKKHDLLFENGININDVPMWQRRGVGIYCKEYDKKGFNPITNEHCVAKRKKTFIDGDIEIGDKYSEFLEEYII